MYAITGITGKVGGELGGTLLAAGQSVRAIVRDVRKGKEWATLGCDLALAEMEDASALTTALQAPRRYSSCHCQSSTLNPTIQRRRR